MIVRLSAGITRLKVNRTKLVDVRQRLGYLRGCVSELSERLILESGSDSGMTSNEVGN